MSWTTRIALAPALVLLSATVCGCAVQPQQSTNCAISWPLIVRPTTATADHAAVAPGNQAQFVGTAAATAPAGCAAPALARQEYAAWENPDPADIQISSANDQTNGLATCLAATNGPVTLTGTFAPITLTGPAGSGPDQTAGSVQLTCK